MLVYRIATSKHVNDLSGEGARLHGGRWNHRGTAVIYTSETRSLATVELVVRLSTLRADRPENGNYRGP